MADQEPIKKKHHYVPSFLLSGFAVEDVLWATDLFEMKQWESIPDRVGLERHYNTTPARNHRPDIAEDLLGAREAEAAPLIQEILESGNLPVNDAGRMQILMHFMALQYLRVPRHRKMTNDALNQVCLPVLEMMTRKEKIFGQQVELAKRNGLSEADCPTFEEVRQCLDSAGLIFAGNPALHLLFGAENELRLARVLSQRKWHLCHSRSGSLICGDSPVTIVNKTPSSGYWGSPGFELSDTEVAFALSRHFAIIGRFEEESRPAVELNRRGVADLNTRVIRQASRFVWSSGRDFPWINERGECRHELGGLKECRVVPNTPET
ncbi:MAG: DUF4238 domain-containing protein [Bryobacterales bacterium]|nr:DUF4238 domain-containing protein [Bryobacterales bacterium]